MKTYEDTLVAVLKKRDEAVIKKQSRARRLKRTLIPVVCGLAVISAGIGLWRSGVLQKKPVLPENTGIEGTLPAVSHDETLQGQAQNAEKDTSGASELNEESSSQGYSVNVPDGDDQAAGPNTSTAVPPETSGIPDDGTVGGDGQGESRMGGNYFCIPALPRNREIVTTGEKITDEEAAAYFAERRDSLSSTLSASGVPADNIRISEKGYCHACYYGVEGERLEVRENFRDYLVYSGDKLVSIITLFKEDGTISSTPSVGAAWFADYNDFLNRHRGEELVYVYSGFAEIILTPDGGMYSALAGIIPEYYMEGIEDPYHVFYHPGDVYVP